MAIAPSVTTDELVAVATSLPTCTKVKLADGSEVNCADVDFVTVRNGLNHYATQYIGAVSVFTTVTDSKDIANLQLFNCRKPCYTDRFSASGYVIPASRLAKEDYEPARKPCASCIPLTA